MEILVIFLVFLSFLVSSSCGLGGSLILIPTLTLALGIREGIIVSSLLLCANNFFKVYFYQKHIHWKNFLLLGIPMSFGAFLGANIMLKIPIQLLGLFLIINLLLTFFTQKNIPVYIQRATGKGFAFISGLLSGMTGTSGPLKGIALKWMHQDKMQLVSTASLVSLFTDLTKSFVYFNGIHLSSINFQMLIPCFALMPIATYLGKKLNEKMSAVAYEALFYSVMSGYLLKLFI